MKKCINLSIGTTTITTKPDTAPDVSYLDQSGFNPGVHIQLRFIDNIRRCVRKVISDTCIPVILNDPALYEVI